MSPCDLQGRRENELDRRQDCQQQEREDLSAQRHGVRTGEKKHSGYVLKSSSEFGRVGQNRARLSLYAETVAGYVLVPPALTRSSRRCGTTAQ